MIDADFEDDLARLANTHVQVIFFFGIAWGK